MSTPVISSSVVAPVAGRNGGMISSSCHEGGGAAFGFDFRAKRDDVELDVFDAEKYLKDGLKLNPKKHVSGGAGKEEEEEEEEEDRASVGVRSSVSGSSRNSRSSLLRRRSKRSPPSSSSSSYRERFMAAIGGCRCYCSGRNSVDVGDEPPVVPENPSSGKLGDDSNGGGGGLMMMSVKFDEPETGNNSDTHFSFPVFARRVSLDLKLPAVAENNDRRRKLPPPETANESDSDASSDLFELESLTKDSSILSNPPESDVHPIPGGKNNAAAATPPENCYAPSEASIEWSVVTASAAEDFDTEEPRIKTAANSKTGTPPPPRFRPISLSVCRSHKAVGVIGDAHRANISKQQQKTPSFIKHKKSPEATHNKLHVKYTRNPPETCYSRNILS